jgi:hypothetical protein
LKEQKLLGQQNKEVIKTALDGTVKKNLSLQKTRLHVDNKKSTERYISLLHVCNAFELLSFNASDNEMFNFFKGLL